MRRLTSLANVWCSLANSSLNPTAVGFADVRQVSSRSRCADRARC